MAYADPSELEKTEYIAGDVGNLVTRLREARDAARMRAVNSDQALRDSVICSFDFMEHTVASQIELLCSRLSEAADALDRQIAPLPFKDIEHG